MLLTLTARRFLPLFLSQFLETFNVNFFKNALFILVTYQITNSSQIGNPSLLTSNVVGAGAVDPVAALTWQLPAATHDDKSPVKHVAAPPEPAPKSPWPRIVAFGGTAALLLAVVAAAAIAARRQKEATL